MADSETSYQQVWQIEKHNTSEHARLSGKDPASIHLAAALNQNAYLNSSGVVAENTLDQQAYILQLQQRNNSLEWHSTRQQSCLIKFHTVSWHV